MKNIRKLFIWAISLIYILGSSIWLHAHMMNNFSDDINGCAHFKEHHSKNSSAQHTQCLDSIYIGYKVISELDFDVLYKYKPIVFDYKADSVNSFEKPLKVNPPPIYESNKQYLKFSDLMGIIVLLN